MHPRVWSDKKTQNIISSLQKVLHNHDQIIKKITLLIR